MPNKPYDYTGIKDADEVIDNFIIEPSNLETIDTAFFNFVNDDIDVFATKGDGFQKVPVAFVSAERSFLSKKTKEGRDHDGTLAFPLISIERTSVDKSNTRSTSYYGPTPNFVDPIHGSYIQINRQIVQDKTNNFAVADNIKNLDGVLRTPNGQAYFPSEGDNNKIVTVSYYLPRPVSITLEYTLSLKSNFIQQMNQMVQPFMTIGDYARAVRIGYEGHRYEAFFASTFTAANNVNNFTDAERNYLTTIKFSVLGYLMGEGDNQIRPKVIKRENAVEVKIPRERVIFGDIQDFDSNNGYYRQS
jgi:hypothetical protein